MSAAAPPRPAIIAVCGASRATDRDLADAREVGRLLAERHVVVVCGGAGGVMEAVARGVRDAAGVCIGLLPGTDAADAAADVTLAIPTGMGEMRNALVARCCTAMIAIGGGYGTLSEVAFALRLAKPVAALRTWTITSPDGYEPDGALRVATTPEEAVAWALTAAASG